MLGPRIGIFTLPPLDTYTLITRAYWRRSSTGPCSATSLCLQVRAQFRAPGAKSILLLTITILLSRHEALAGTCRK